MVYILLPYWDLPTIRSEGTWKNCMGYDIYPIESIRGSNVLTWMTTHTHTNDVYCLMRLLCDWYPSCRRVTLRLYITARSTSVQRLFHSLPSYPHIWFHIWIWCYVHCRPLSSSSALVLCIWLNKNTVVNTQNSIDRNYLYLYVDLSALILIPRKVRMNSFCTYSHWMYAFHSMMAVLLS